MMLRYTFGLSTEADAIEKAVSDFLEKGYRTKDIAQHNDTFYTTKEVGDIISSLIY